MAFSASFTNNQRGMTDGGRTTGTLYDANGFALGSVAQGYHRDANGYSYYSDGTRTYRQGSSGYGQATNPSPTLMEMLAQSRANPNQDKRDPNDVTQMDNWEKERYYLKKQVDAENQIEGSINDLKNTAKDGYGEAKRMFDNAPGLINSAIDTGKGLGEAANKVDAMGSIVGRQANKLNPYIDQLTNIGNGLLGQANDLSSMNPNAGGIIGEYVNNLKSYDPNRLVSLAASDVQNSYANAEGQLDRQLARQGLDSGSARSTVMKQQFAQSLAAALAGAKTRARMQGVTEQTNALRGALADTMSLNAEAQKATAAAASIEKDKAGVLISSADLFAKAGTLRGEQANLILNAADAFIKQGTAQSNLTTSQVNAYNAAVQAQIELAKYYSDTVEGYSYANFVKKN